MSADVGVAVVIASPCAAVQNLFPLPVSTSGFVPTFEFPMSPMSGCVGSAIAESGVVENMGVAVAIASPSAAVQKLFPLPVSTCGLVPPF